MVYFNSEVYFFCLCFCPQYTHNLGERDSLYKGKLLGKIIQTCMFLYCILTPGKINPKVKLNKRKPQ